MEDQQFRAWWCAAIPSMSRRMVIRVAGMDEKDIGVNDD